MRHRNRLALGALAAAIVTVAAGAGVYAMRPSDEAPASGNNEPETAQTDSARRKAPPGGSSVASAMCAPEQPDCNDTLVQTDTELTCEEAGACAEAPPSDCPPDAECGSGSAACAEGAPCSRPMQTYECIEPQGDVATPCDVNPCDIGGGPAENVRCFPPEPCEPAPEPGGGGGGVMPMEPGVDGATPVDPDPAAPPLVAPTPCGRPPFPPDCAISSDGAIACPDDPPTDSGPGGSEPGSPGDPPPPIAVTAVAQ